MPFARTILRLALTMPALLAACASQPETVVRPDPTPLDSVRPANPRRTPPPATDPIRLPDPTGLARRAILPARRIVAFYGNPRSDRMGILGELPPDQMLKRLDAEVAAWERADPATPVQPALHLIAVMASASPGDDGAYRVRMPAAVIEQVLQWAARRNAIVFLDIQPGRSSVREEIRHLTPWLTRPNVHLALDPEWAMRRDQLPGRVVGSMAAADINHAIRTLASLVDDFALPPKVLVVHRFTAGMVRNVQELIHDPRVQTVLNMDGWGPPATKITAYRNFVARAPVPFTGFKVFYRNDRRAGSRLMTPTEILALRPAPLYIQYQ